MLYSKKQSHFSSFSSQRGKTRRDRVLRSYQDLSFGHDIPRMSGHVSLGLGGGWVGGACELFPCSRAEATGMYEVTEAERERDPHSIQKQLSYSKQNTQILEDFEVNDLEEFPLWCGIPQSSLAAGGILLASGCGLADTTFIKPVWKPCLHPQSHARPRAPTISLLLPFMLALHVYHSI